MRRGLKRIEVGIAIGCTIVLLSLLTPGLLYLREQQRTTQCADNLRRVGILFHERAVREADGRFSTGAPDVVRDGCPDEYGWIADVVPHLGSGFSTLHCPSTTVDGLHHLGQLLIVETPDADAERADRIDSGLCNSTDGLLATKPLSAERAAVVADFVNRGYNSSYSASWHLVRGQPVFADEGDALRASEMTIGGDLESLERTTGPLTLRQVELSDFPSSTIPLLGDTSSGPKSLDVSVSDSLPAGTLLGRSFGAGPSFWDPKTVSTRPIGVLGKKLDARGVTVNAYPPAGTMMDASTAALHESSVPLESGGPCRLVLIDTRNWGATHGTAINLLMADGRVARIRDQDDDGFANPGFPVHPKSRARRHDYGDALAEIAVDRVFTGCHLSLRLFVTGSFPRPPVWAGPSQRGSQR